MTDKGLTSTGGVVFGEESASGAGFDALALGEERARQTSCAFNASDGACFAEVRDSTGGTLRSASWENGPSSGRLCTENRNTHTVAKLLLVIRNQLRTLAYTVPIRSQADAIEQKGASWARSAVVRRGAAARVAAAIAGTAVSCVAEGARGTESAIGSRGLNRVALGLVVAVAGEAGPAAYADSVRARASRAAGVAFCATQ